jgi:hypothetical protein
VVANARVFLLSPAKAGGKRHSLLVREQASFDLAIRLRQGTATIGDVYSFMSGLYFRGKMAYAEAFGNAPDGLPPAVIIVPGRGLITPETIVNMDDLRAIAEVPVDEDNPVYREALLKAARLLDQRFDRQRTCEYVLLGSVASTKYTGPLVEVFGERLLFPADFVGRGDMSRGGLMLRCAAAKTELLCVPVQGARLRGSRPAKLDKRQTQPPNTYDL